MEPHGLTPVVPAAAGRTAAGGAAESHVAENLVPHFAPRCGACRDYHACLHPWTLGHGFRLSGIKLQLFIPDIIKHAPAVARDSYTHPPLRELLVCNFS